MEATVQNIPTHTRQFLQLIELVRTAQKNYYASEPRSYNRSECLKISKLTEQRCCKMREMIDVILSLDAALPERNHMLLLKQVCATWDDLWRKQVAYWDSKEYAVHLGDAMLLQKAKSAEVVIDRFIPKWKKALKIFDSQLNSKVA